MGEEGLLVKAQESLNAAKAAVGIAMTRQGLTIDNTRAALDDALSRAALAEAPLNAVDIAMANSQEAMDNAHWALDALLRTSTESEMVAGQAEEQHFQAAISAAMGALVKAEIAAASTKMNIVTGLE